MVRTRFQALKKTKTKTKTKQKTKNKPIQKKSHRFSGETYVNIVPQFSLVGNKYHYYRNKFCLSVGEKEEKFLVFATSHVQGEDLAKNQNS